MESADFGVNKSSQDAAMFEQCNDVNSFLTGNHSMGEHVGAQQN